MKRIFPILMLLLGWSLNAQTIYVKHNASGANNGASWANAYTSLEQALSVASPGQTIWVAAGTYKPTASSDYTFPVADGMQLYGGFAGTESSLNQRNIAANPTILSGDINGDDIPGNFTDNRSDNSQHVVTCIELSSNPGVVVDGFTIRNGHTLLGTGNPDLSRRGGGILIYTKSTVRNCVIEQNFGDTGAAIAALDALSNGCVVENCLIQNNKAETSGAFFLRNTNGATIKKCVFKTNTVNRGALYPSGTLNVQIDSCLFEKNNAGENFGAGMFCWQATFSLTNSIFRGNKAANAAGMYIDNRDGGDLVVIDHCLFEQDTATSFGGAGIYGWQASFNLKNTIFRENYAPNAAAIYCNGREFDSSFSLEGCLFEKNINTDYGATFWNNRTNYTVTDCEFKDNVAPSSGAAIYNGDTTIFLVSNSLFQANRGNYAAAIANYGIGCYGTFENCTFRDNLATQGGGAASNGFKADVEYKGCEFIENKGSFAAAIFTQNDTTRLRVNDCYFTSNICEGSGGCILVNTNIAASITNTQFYLNFADFGGAIAANGDSLLILDRCIFLENFATTQAAAINFNHVNALLTNCLFGKNINSGDGAGGGISSNASDGQVSSVKAVNCTFANNLATLGAGIAQWEESDNAIAELYLTNCLFQNPDGENYSIEEGTPDVISTGGNQSSDGSLTAYLTAAKDLSNTSQTFTDPDNNDFRPLPGSPAANGGVTTGAPDVDITGAPRTGTPDVGCYEFNTVNVNVPGLKLLPLSCAPNPAHNQTAVSLSNARQGQVEISVWNQTGQRVVSVLVEKTGEQLNHTLNVQQLPAGVYKIQARMGDMLHESVLVKQ